MPLSTEYSLKLINNSAQSWTFYVYQELPRQEAGIFSLAWFASPYKMRVGTEITFSWEINYNFVWTDTGVLMPGVLFEAQGTVDCDPHGVNTTQFSMDTGPGLGLPEQGPPLGSLVINDAANVPNSRFSVGVGMSGVGTHAIQAGTNLRHILTPTPSYWVAAGNDVKIGTVLDIETITQNAEVKFEPNVFDMKCTLGSANTWSVTSGE